METTLNYSPNFDIKKRNKKDIKFIIFHYTGMKKEIDAIKKLTNKKAKVSSHYLIKSNGEILTLVPDLYVAWHAGVSSWKKYNSINKKSIGIEISNPGHNYKYKKFSKNQINSLIILSKYLIKKYKIKSKYILGHSDISPDRKKDPGEKFPWFELAKKDLCLWHKLNLKKIKRLRKIKVNELQEKTFFRNLYKIGYSRSNKTLLVEAFQRRYRQSLINGKIDQECLKISENLI